MSGLIQRVMIVTACCAGLAMAGAGLFMIVPSRVTVGVAALAQLPVLAMLVACIYLRWKHNTGRGR